MLFANCCDAHCRSGRRCRNRPLTGKRRCALHGGLSTGAKSLDGKQRQAEGRERWLCKLRGRGRKPGPAKGTGGRARKTTVDPVERQRLNVLAALDDLESNGGARDRPR
jgi:hypothetical protein